jgi:small subunit ribosomal protein S21
LQPDFEQIEVKDMLIIPVKEGESIERSLKKFKRKFEKTGAMRDLRNRKQYVKPSIERRKEMKKAAYVQGLRIQEEG